MISALHAPPLLPRGPHGAHVVHQLLVLHEAAAAEVAGPRAPRDARPCRARRGARVGAARPPGEDKQWNFLFLSNSLKCKSCLKFEVHSVYLVEISAY